MNRAPSKRNMPTTSVGKEKALAPLQDLLADVLGRLEALEAKTGITAHHGLLSSSSHHETIASVVPSGAYR